MRAFLISTAMGGLLLASCTENYAKPVNAVKAVVTSSQEVVTNEIAARPSVLRKYAILAWWNKGNNPKWQPIIDTKNPADSFARYICIEYYDKTTMQNTAKERLAHVGNYTSSLTETVNPGEDTLSGQWETTKRLHNRSYGLPTFKAPEAKDIGLKECLDQVKAKINNVPKSQAAPQFNPQVLGLAEGLAATGAIIKAEAAVETGIKDGLSIFNAYKRKQVLIKQTKTAAPELKEQLDALREELHAIYVLYNERIALQLYIPYLRFQSIIALRPTPERSITEILKTATENKNSKHRIDLKQQVLDRPLMIAIEENEKLEENLKGQNFLKAMSATDQQFSTIADNIQKAHQNLMDSLANDEVDLTEIYNKINMLKKDVDDIRSLTQGAIDSVEKL